MNADDLERAVEASKLSPEIIEKERQLLHHILDLSDLTAEEVMRRAEEWIEGQVAILTSSATERDAHAAGTAVPG